METPDSITVEGRWGATSSFVLHGHKRNQGRLLVPGGNRMGDVIPSLWVKEDEGGTVLSSVSNHSWKVEYWASSS